MQTAVTNGNIPVLVYCARNPFFNAFTSMVVKFAWIISRKQYDTSEKKILRLYVSVKLENHSTIYTIITFIGDVYRGGASVLDVMSS